MRKKALSLLLALTLCLTALTPAAALGAGDAPEQPAAQEQTVSGGQKTPAGGQDASVSEEQEEPVPEEEEAPASEKEPEESASGEDESASEEQTKPAEEEPEQPAAAPAAEPVLLAAANGIAVPSGETGHTPHDICGDENCTEHGGKDASWIAISSLSDLQYVGSNEGTGEPAAQDTIYYCFLTTEITTPSYGFTFYNAKNVVLCLNGHSITGPDENVPVITVEAGKTFTLCDCGGEGQIIQQTASTNSGGNKGGVKVDGGTFNLYGGTITKETGDSQYTIGVDVSSGTFNMYGGAISGNYTAGNGGGVHVESGGVFELYGGSITNNLAVGYYPVGGGVKVDGGTFNMHDGSITNNNAGATGCKGGGVCVDNGGTFNMSGGSISGNNAATTTHSASGKGGGVYVADGTFNMTGGTICGNTANNSATSGNGGGVYVESGTFTVSGNANISGNKAGATSAAATEANNVYLAGSSQTIKVGGNLNDGARIGVVASNGAVVAVPATGSNVTLTTDDAAKFVSDSDGSYRGTLNGDGNVKLASVPHSHCIYGETNCTDGTNHGSSRIFAGELWMDPDGNLWTGNTALTVSTKGSYGSNKYYELAAGSSSGTVTYYLGGDLELDYPIYITRGTVRLCLNGHELKLAPVGTNNSVSGVITLDYTYYNSGNSSGGSAILNLTDCKPDGKVGTVTHSNDGKGRGVELSNGAFNMYGGSITGNKTTGGGVYVDSGTAFSLYGGSITGNTAANNGGGGVYVSGGGTFNMLGGEITGNTAAGSGGGVYVSNSIGSIGKFTMSGGEISGNKADSYGGGVYVTPYNSTFTMSGDVTITGNKVGGADNNVYLPTDKTITVAAALGDSAKIGVTTAAKPSDDNPVIVAEPKNSSVSLSAANFSSDESYEVQLDGSKVVLAVPSVQTHEHYLCGKDTCTAVGDHAVETAKTTFEAALTQDTNGDLLENGTKLDTKSVTLNGTTATGYVLESGKHYYLGGDLDLRYSLYITGGEVSLCLNGHELKLTQTDSNSIYNVIHFAGDSTKTLNLTDCAPNGTPGTVTHGKDGSGKAYLGSGVWMYINSTLNLYGGDITGNDGYSQSGGVNAYGTFNMYGGSITNNTSSLKRDGGGVDVNQPCIFNMYAGTISGNTAAGDGGGVYVGLGGTFNLSGGEISKNTAKGGKGGGVYVADGGTLTVSGAAKVTGNTVDSKDNNVYLPSGVTMAIGTGGLSGTIGVTTEKKPTASQPVVIANNTGKFSGLTLHIVSDDAAYKTAVGDNTIVLKVKDGSTSGEKTDPDYTPPTAKNLTYTGQAQALIEPGTVTGGEMQYKLDGSNEYSTYSTAIPKATEPGTYTVYYRVLGDATHNDVEERSITVTISEKPEVPVASITLDKTSTSLKVGGSVTLTATVSPTDATNKNVTWESSDTTVATVTNGVVKALKTGTAAITVTAADGSGKSAICKVTVTAASGGSTGGGGGGGSTGGGGGGGASVPTYPVSSSNASASAAVGGSVSASTKNATAGSTVTVTVSPEAGYRLEKLTVVDKNGKEIPVTLKDGKYTFTMPASQVDIKPVFEKISAETAFPDVPSSAYYAEPVKWAAEKGITSGTKDGGFAPGNTCTRAQIVTFLWRAAGSPEPQTAETGMTDVSPAAYYAKAVAWAIENGITVGRSDGSFNPNGTCTRANGVTFLYRAARAAASGNDAGFSDVTADAYYAAAVQWALENGITNGQSNGLFGPNGACTRAQIVTFLYRLYVKA